MSSYLFEALDCPGVKVPGVQATCRRYRVGVKETLSSPPSFPSPALPSTTWDMKIYMGRSCCGKGQGEGHPLHGRWWWLPGGGCVFPATSFPTPQSLARECPVTPWWTLSGPGSGLVQSQGRTSFLSFWQLPPWVVCRVVSDQTPKTCTWGNHLMYCTEGCPVTRKALPS